MIKKRIISTALALVMVFGIFAAIVPLRADAAYSDTVYTEEKLTDDEIKAVVSAALDYNFSSAEEMLTYELGKGYLMAANSANGTYTMYVNRYTGVLYYVNNLTGQILTSNPYDVGYTSSGRKLSLDNRRALMSQITASFFEIANPTNKYDYGSARWAAEECQIDVKRIVGGIRVNYALGDTSVRFLLPGLILSDSFENNILKPMLATLVTYLNEYCRDEGDTETNFSFFDNDEYESYAYGCVDITALKSYLNEMQSLYTSTVHDEETFDAMEAVVRAIRLIINSYSQKNPVRHNATGATDIANSIYEQYPVTKENDGKTAVYEYRRDAVVAQKRSDSALITTYCPDYTFTMMYEDEEKCGYKDDSEQKPVIRCALEYTFNSDGSMSIRLPASSINFDETVYTLTSIIPVRYFGAGNMTSDGYIFYPDGSGTVMSFRDFYSDTKKVGVSLNSPVYGNDFCYSNITGQHRQQITMPVYGVVNTVNANERTYRIYGVKEVSNGYFAILEEGAALASLCYESGGSQNKYANAYARYNPYPSDDYSLPGTSAVYTMVSESKYTGSYVTRITMLTDDTVGEKSVSSYGSAGYYPASYVGMATCYRNYLKSRGELTKLETVSGDIPLYIEALGAMDVIKKILTFPITVSVPLTTFDDVASMYEQLSTPKEYLAALAEKSRADAAAADDATLREQYIATAEKYEALISEVEAIKNINFRLTGFTNGGMDATYPTRLKWQRSCGGKSGFSELVNTAATVSEKDGYHFGVYPDFDMQYINRTSLFDGISVRGNVSRMVDNRYASKQIYESVAQEFATSYSLVISSDSLDKLYSKLDRQYSKYALKSISFSTIGSDLNSNFDEKNPINREESMSNVLALLARVKNTSGYDIMVDNGNAYTLKYASHILNIATDSSHFRYASYAVPFIGIVLHGYVNYTGSPINYAGSPEYELLRSIENGAYLYYILCAQNSAEMKDDEDLSDYYGVDYNNWYSNILKTYGELNSVLRDLQTYEITNHVVLKAERQVEESESAANYVRLKAEIVSLLRSQSAERIDEAFRAMKGDPANVGRGVKVTYDRDALLSQFADVLRLDVSGLGDEFIAEIDAVIAEYTEEYPGTSENPYVLDISEIDYKSQYSYITDSFALDKDYKFTDYTCYNGNVVMVTYSDGEHEVSFILNYNIFTVNVTLDSGHTYTLGRYEYVRIG